MKLLPNGCTALEENRKALRRRRKLPDAVRRQEATQATLDKFKDTAFDWKAGRHCLKLAFYQMRQMGKRPPPLPEVHSVIGAKKQLRRKGFETVSEALDSLLPRITPAQMMVGDLAALPGDDGLDAIFVCCGPRRVFGWREDQPTAVVLEVRLDEIETAWKV